MHLKIVLFQADAGVLLAILPPGAFLALGFIIAAKNLVDARLSHRKAVLKPQVERARMTTL